MRIATAIGVLLLSCTTALATAYDDFAQGIAANAQNDSELAIKSFSTAIAAPDLSPALLPQAYRGRGEALLHQNKCHAALADLDQALKINATDWATLVLRGSARDCDGDLAGAEADFSAAIAVKPAPGLYLDRGRLRFREQDFDGAARDFVLYTPDKSKRVYRVLWLETARRRGGSLDAKVAADDVASLDSDDWPAPLLAVYTGKATPDAVLAATGDDADHHQCEAAFYMGEWHLGGGDADAARALFQKAVAGCPHNFVEYRAAQFELGRMK